MAQSGYTPISLYYSTTVSAVPTNTNLVNGELAINITDGKLYYKDNGGVVQTLASKATGTIGGSTTQIQYNNSGVLAGSANLTFDGSNVQIGAQGDLRFADADSSNWVAFQAPATVASNITWTLPNADGTNGQVLTTNGTGTLTWTTAATNVTISNDTSTASDLYPTFVTATTGTASTLNTSNAKLLYRPSTGEFKVSAPIASNGIVLNNTTVAASYTIASGVNGMSIGPITINSGITVTVSSGQRWLVL